ncbi:Nitrate/nitrite transporter NarK [Paraburkholderia fungorum]|uniref:Nitrate/nitrite transporter NarK n=1 Tax=Paraburkholderia fungorum TaxID=134537 RepID=A0A1H1JUQ2_9BURK|nr:MFS transporter [Paraburkholderia fungorum]SDR53753.1 Nitrate/nitrite transporter NarK [Paraburkholderia fungorum]
MTHELKESTIRKLTGRLIPLLFLIWFVNYMDRTNISFAALQMNKELGLTPQMFGFAAGIFYAGYILFEIPSNMLMRRFGARVWIARIIFTWGIVSVGQAAIHSPYQLYSARFLLGIAEAGFLPGVMYYLNCWFPADHRARAIGQVYSANTLSIVVGAPLSGIVMAYMDQIAGLSGWKWMFIMEGVPAILLGVFTFFYLTSRPADAKWLSVEEREWLISSMQQDQEVAEKLGTSSFRAAMSDPIVWLLGLLYFSIGIGFFGVSVWLPQVIKQMSDLSIVQVGFVNAIPFLIGTVVMLINGRHSDRTGERRWHLTIPLGIGTIGLIASAMTPSQPLLSFVFVCIATTGIVGAFSVFWTVPSAFLTGAGAAGGLALVNTISGLAGLSAPYLIGWIRGRTPDFSAATFVMAGGIGLATLLAAFLPYPERAGFKSKKRHATT